MQNLRILACVVAALGSLTAAGCGDDNDCDNGNLNDPHCFPTSGGSAAVVRVQNNCDVAITEIHVASNTTNNTPNWGTNLISSTTTLAKGQSLTIAIPCGTYNVLLVDDNRHTATFNDVNVCPSNAGWTIGGTDCTAFTIQHPDPVAAPASSAAP